MRDPRGIVSSRGVAFGRKDARTSSTALCQMLFDDLKMKESVPKDRFDRDTSALVILTNFDFTCILSISI